MVNACGAAQSVAAVKRSPAARNALPAAKSPPWATKGFQLPKEGARLQTVGVLLQSKEGPAAHWGSPGACLPHRARPVWL